MEIKKTGSQYNCKYVPAHIYERLEENFRK
jgi:hypothetical protein